MTLPGRRAVLLALLALSVLMWPASAGAAGSGGSGPSEVVFIVQIVVLMIVGRLLGEFMLRLGQPAVMGQLIAGLILGPSLFGAVLPDLQHMLFPRTPEQKAMIDAISQFGILLLLLLTGMETDLKLVRQTGRASFYASAMGIVVPFVCGVTLGMFLPEHMLPAPDKRLITALFLGTALSIASVKIVAMVVREMNFMRRVVGQVIIASAIIDDSIGWIIVSIIFSIALQGQIDPVSIAQSVIGTAIFLVASFTVGRRAVFFVIRWVNDNFESEFPVITAILCIMAIMALITHLIGVHTVLGAFIAGILVGQSPILTRHIDDELRGLTTAFFAPVFFGIAGLSADLTVLADPQIALLTIGLVLIASLGKFGGAFTGAELGGLTRREGFALACGMNARGSTEVIIATVGLSMGALTQNLFTMIVAMAVITTMAMPPTLRWALSRIPLRKEEKRRLEREALEEKGFVPNIDRLLIAVDDSANARFAARLGGMLAGLRGKPATVLHFTGLKTETKASTDKKAEDGTADAKAAGDEAPATDTKTADTSGADTSTSGKAARDAAAAAEEKVAAENGGTANQAAKSGDEPEEKKPDSATVIVSNAARQVQKSLKKDEKTDTAPNLTTLVREVPTTELIAEEAEKGYDILIAGLEKMTVDDKEFHSDVVAMAKGFEGPLAIVTTRGTVHDDPDSKFSMLVPINGTGASRRAAEVAIVMSRATKATITFLYVTSSGDAAKKGAKRHRLTEQERAFLKDVSDIARSYGVKAKTAAMGGSETSSAILAEATRRKHNLIVSGVTRRTGEKLYFGDTAAGLLEKADCTVVFVAT
ncbi:MAG: cation:proton antiporter [Xanthobacteraceae bacterium]|uniref:cation:proton antiporter domain-containing protein n=1 Tax=Pseudolabrys sp. TaxID=1960880 RepID=UPI003D0C3894